MLFTTKLISEYMRLIGHIHANKVTVDIAVLSLFGHMTLSVVSLDVENNTYPFPYQSQYQPETPISARGPGMILVEG